MRRLGACHVESCVFESLGLCEESKELVFFELSCKLLVLVHQVFFTFLDGHVIGDVIAIHYRLLAHKSKLGGSIIIILSEIKVVFCFWMFYLVALGMNKLRFIFLKLFFVLSITIINETKHDHIKISKLISILF